MDTRTENKNEQAGSAGIEVPSRVEFAAVDTPAPMQRHKKRSRKKWLLIGVGTLATAFVAIGILYVYVLRQPTARELYDQAYADSLTTDASKKAYASLNLTSDATEIEGEVNGNFSGNKSQGAFNMKADTEISGIPVTMDMDMRGIDNGKESTDYYKYNSVTTSDSQYAQNIKDYFAPVLDKWIKSTSKDNNENASDFSSGGPTAALDVAAIFMPMSSMSSKDKTVYLDATRKYHLVTVDKEVVATQFKGISARELHVSISKGSFKQFNNELATSLSKEAEYFKNSNQYIDDFFGNANTFPATVYIAEGKPQFLGIDYNVRFSKPLTEDSFNTTMKHVNVSILIDYGRNYTIQVPEKTITMDEYQALLGS